MNKSLLKNTKASAAWMGLRNDRTATLEMVDTVRGVLMDVKNKGDAAVKQYTRLFDKVDLEDLKLADKAWCTLDTLDTRYQQAIQVAYDNIYRIHALDKPQAFSTEDKGIQIDKIYRAIDRVGLYIPGGTAPLVSTVLMLGIPAQIAGCQEVVLVTPPDKQGLVNPAILYAARLCGIQSIYTVGGAQGIAALAYGTESIPKVDKIFGPGNAYVMEAKNQVAQDPDGAALDMPAGPSEVMVIADGEANAMFVAADLLAQAEHDELAKCVLLTTSEELASEVRLEIQRQMQELKRERQLKAAVQAALILVVPELSECVEMANEYAPEHLILQVRDPRQYLSSIRSAGSVFLGPWSVEAFGDYASGTNHVLPTAGYAKTYSGIGVAQFMKSITVQEVSPQGFLNLAPYVEALAELETLDGHQYSVSRRREVLEKRS